MTEELLLGVDIGTATTKAVLARPDGSIAAEAQRRHELSLPRPGWAEHDANSIWWNDFVAVCRELAPLAGTGLRAVCVSGIGPCVVPCDASGRALRPAILYGIDTRAGEQVDQLNELFGETAILQRGGSTLSSQALGPKLLWLRQHEPAVWNATARWYMASSYLVAHLTGAYVLDHHSASQCNPLYDLEASAWAHDWADEVAGGVTLPELVWPTDQVGVVTPQAAETTGLPKGTPVVAGTIDAWAEAFSVGVRNPGDLMLMYGSTMFFVQVAERPRRQPLLWTTAGLEQGTRTLAAGMSTAGSLTDWLRTLTGNPDWEVLVAEAETVPPGSDGLLLLPYFAGERTPIYDPHARGVIAGLQLSHRRGHLLRAAYEGLAFGTRQIVDLLANASNEHPRFVAVGGGTKSTLWLQTVSDVSGVTQQIPRVTAGASYGDALLAAIGVSLVSRESDWTVIDHEIDPSSELVDEYHDLYELYLRLYLDSAPVVHAISQSAVRRSRLPGALG